MVRARYLAARFVVTCDPAILFGDCFLTAFFLVFYKKNLLAASPWRTMTSHLAKPFFRHSSMQKGGEKMETICPNREFPLARLRPIVTKTRSRWNWKSRRPWTNNRNRPPLQGRQTDEDQRKYGARRSAGRRKGQGNLPADT
jgi:hypothetical protein